MSSCATVPTETQFQVVTTTSDSLSTSFSTAVTTLPPTVVTSALVCSGSSSNSACSASTFVVSGPASVSTNTVAVTVTVPVTFTTSNPTRTLFSTSCSPSSTTTSTSGASTFQSSQSTSTSSPAPASASSSSPSPSSSSDSSSLLPPSSSAFTTTLSNGSVVTAQVIVTTTSPGSSTSVVLSSSPSPSLNRSGTGGGSSSSKTGPIVGGVVGGVVALLAIIGCIWFFWRRRSKRWNDFLEKEEYEENRRPRMALDGEDVQPRPYHYGLVGHSATPSPPGSPPLGAADPGHSPSNSLSMLNAPPTRSRSSSGDALSSMTRSLPDLGSATQIGHTRPSLSIASSAAASTRPLLERPVNHARSPSIPTADLLGVGRSQPSLLTPRPNSAGGSTQGGSTPAFGTSTEPVPRLPISSTDEKRRLLAALPQGAAAPTPPALAIESGSPPVQVPHTDSRPPPIRPRDPKRPSSTKNSSTVTVHVDGGPAAETDPRSPPGGSNEPPAYSPT